MPTATEDEIGWRLVEEMSVKGGDAAGADLRRAAGHNGRLSIQTDPRFTATPQPSSARPMHFDGLAPNMIVKIPVTAAGIPAIEEATYRGISINATVSFTLPQCVAVAEAVERGLAAVTREGKDISTMGPVCTIMVGRLDDWLKVQTEQERTSASIPATSNGPASRYSRKRTGCSGNAATACACYRRPFAITCTGASSSAATS